MNETKPPAAMGPVDAPVGPTLEEALGTYWDAAYAEGREGRDHDTELGDAQRALTDIMSAVAALVDAERERWTYLLGRWVVEAESESGPEAAAWLQRAIDRLGPNVEVHRQDPAPLT